MYNTSDILNYIIKAIKEAIEEEISKSQFIWKDGKIQGELVTCQHCKHWYAPGLFCDKWKIDGLFVDDFCSKGERK